MFPLKYHKKEVHSDHFEPLKALPFIKVMFKTNQKGTHYSKPCMYSLPKKQLQGVWCCVFVQRLNLDTFH